MNDQISARSLERVGNRFFVSCFDASIIGIKHNELLETVTHKSGYRFAKELRNVTDYGTKMPTPYSIAIMMADLLEKIKPQNGSDTTILIGISKDLLRLVIAAQQYLVQKCGDNPWTHKQYYKLIKELHFYLD